jgi:hypothetical protein
VCVFDCTYYKITTTNYISKTSIYYILHVSIETLATENLDVCTACDPWDSNIPLTMGKDQRQQIYVGFVADQNLGGASPWGRACLSWRATHAQKGVLFISARCPPLGLGMPFLDSDTGAEGGGGVYLFLPGFSSLYDAIHGWMTRRIDEKLHEKRPRQDGNVCKGRKGLQKIDPHSLLPCNNPPQSITLT